MSIPAEKIYPRKGDTQTVYLKAVVQNPNISVGAYTMYNDFQKNPMDFEKNNVLYQYPVNHDRLFIGNFCSIACGAKFIFTSANHTLEMCIRDSRHAAGASIRAPDIPGGWRLRKYKRLPYSEGERESESS